MTANRLTHFCVTTHSLPSRHSRTAPMPTHLKKSPHPPQKRGSGSTITSRHSAQCQRRNLPPHPNPPRNPPARQYSSNRNFNLFDQTRKSQSLTFPCQEEGASYGLGWIGFGYKRSSSQKLIHHSHKTKPTEKISRFLQYSISLQYLMLLT